MSRTLNPKFVRLSVANPLRWSTIKGALQLIPVVCLALPALSAAQSALPNSSGETASAASALFERVIGNQKKSEEALDLYERFERLETRKNPNDPVPASMKFSRVVPSGTGMTKIPVNEDGKAADEAAYRARLEGLEHALALIVNDYRSQRDAVEKYTKRRKDRLDLIEATKSAFLFKFVTRELRGNLLLAKYEMSPNPSFKPTSRFTAIFPKVHGYVWIDEDSGQLARIEGDVTGDVSIGLFLAKIYKGSHFMQENYQVQPGLWLPSFSQYDFDGRRLFSGFAIHERTFSSNYRYVGPPKEALEVIRKELGHTDLSKPVPPASDP